MQGLIHTTELGRLYKPQALSPRLPPLPPSSPARDGVQKFKFHAPAANGAETSSMSIHKILNPNAKTLNPSDPKP